jgi:hypothetical protein
MSYDNRNLYPIPQIQASDNNEAIKGELDRSLEKILELINKVRDNN